VCVGINTMNKREKERKARITSIHEALRKIKESEKELDLEKFLFKIMWDYGISRRTAREYIKTARSQL